MSGDRKAAACHMDRVHEYAKVPLDGTPVLFLGNGFSRAFDDQVFSYKSLSEAVDLQPFELQLSKLFDVLGSRDFEFAMNTLERAALAIPAFAESGKAHNPTHELLTRGASLLRERLGSAVLANHPIASTVVVSQQSAACARFLRPYRAIFTTNYDLLLYWVLMQQQEALKDPRYGPKFIDGFGWATLDQQGPIWPSGNTARQNVFYLHGALHLFRGKSGLEKVRYTQGGPALKSLIQDRVLSGKLPILVTEGAGSQKVDRILEAPYLCHAYQNLLSAKGRFVTLGFGFNQSDSHILHALVMNKVTELWIGVFQDVGEVPDHRLLDVARDLHEKRAAFQADRPAKRSGPDTPLNVHFYSTKTLNLWGHDPVAATSRSSR